MIAEQQSSFFDSGMRSVTFFQNLSIRSKVLSAFVVVLLLADGLGLFALQHLSAVNEASAEIRDDWLPSLRVVGQLSTVSERIRANQNTYLMQPDDKGRDNLIKVLQAAIDLRDKAWREYQPTITAGE